MYPEGKERPKKEVGHSGLVGGSFNKQREFTHEVCFGWQQDEWIFVPAHQILKFYKEALTELIQVYCAGVLNTTSLSQGYVLRAASGSGKGRWNPYTKDREEGKEALIAWGPAHRSPGSHIFFMTFPSSGKVLDIGLSDFFFLNLTLNARETKAKMNKWDYFLVKGYCTVKENINKTKKQPSKWERIFVSNISIKGLISEIYKGFI